MSQGSTLFRFKVSLSDVERAVYETLDFRVARHSSETEAFLLTRVLAYILNFQEGLEFTQGLSTPDEPSIRLLDGNGTIALWIDIGNPSARRLHRASKACKFVRVYTYKDPKVLMSELSGEEVHRADQIGIYSLDPAFLGELAGALGRENLWTVIHDGGELIATSGGETWMSQLGIHRLQ